MGFGDLRVVHGEVVAGVAEGAAPDLRDEIDLCERIKDGAALLAADRLVREDRHLVHFPAYMKNSGD